MAASISSTGIGSGLDVNQIVTSLMTLEKRPLTQLQNRASATQAQLSAYGSLSSQVSTLGDLATRLADAANWKPLRVDSSDATSVQGTVSATAQAGSHVVQVQQLAQGQSLASAAYAQTSTVVGTGTLTLSTGTTAGSVFTPGSAAPVVITIGEANKTLAGVRDAINAAQAGVTASIVTSGAGSQLVLRGADGAASSLRLSVSDADGNATDTAGLSALAWDPAAPVGAGRNLSQTQAAQDALFTLDSLALTSPGNSPQGLVDGLTLSFRKVTTGPVTVAVTTDAMVVRKNVNDFVSAYNGLNQLLKTQLKAGTGGGASGPLQADATALSVLHSLRAALGGAVDGLTDGPAGLNAAGIELQRDGSLKVNETRLAPLLATPDKLSRLFSQAQDGTNAGTRGIAVRLRQWADALTGSTGKLAGRTGGLQHTLTALQRREEGESDRLSRTEARLRAQYQSLDSVMGRLNAQLKQVTAAFGSKIDSA